MHLFSPDRVLSTGSREWRGLCRQGVTSCGVAVRAQQIMSRQLKAVKGQGQWIQRKS